MRNPYLKTMNPPLEKFDYVKINEKRLREVAKQWAREDLSAPAWDTHYVHPPLDCSLEEWTDYVGWLNTVNFAFTNFGFPWPKFAIEYPAGSIWSGAYALGASFMRANAEGIPVFNAEYMSSITPEQVAYMFRGIVPIPMQASRWEIFQEVGRILLEKYDGKFLNVFEAGNWRAFNNGHGIVEQLVSNFPSFCDRSWHRKSGQYFEFHKRPQLVVLMHHGRAENSNGRFPLIKDAEDIGPPADYEIPRGLEFEGILVYHPVLKLHIRLRHLIPKDSIWEQNIRCQDANAMVLMVRIINEILGPKNEITQVNGDFRGWLAGRKSPTPHHLTRTIAY